jgi:HSP20 family protein
MALPTRTRPPRGTADEPKARGLTRWEPLRELEELRTRMDRVMDSFWGGETDGADGTTWSPVADVEETDDAWVVKAELPGVQRDDVTVEVRDAELRISGQLDEEREREGTPRRRMRRMGRFEYRTALPAEVDPDQVEARLDNGVLTVRVPRPEGSQPHKVEVKS